MTTPISPIASREELIAMIHNRDALVSDLKECVESARSALREIDAMPCSMVNDSESLRHTIKTIQSIARKAVS